MAVATQTVPEEPVPHPRARRLTWLQEDFVDRTRARAATLNQLLLGSVVFALAFMIAFGPFAGDVVLFFTGVVVIAVVTGATLVIPWNRVAPGWVALVPAVDIVAITLIQVSAPGSALGLLWIFPTTWLAAGFGLFGLIAVVVAGVGIAALLTALNQHFTYATLLLPLVLIAVATTSHLSARRSDAQRMLLAKQSHLLRRLLERTRRQEQELTEVLDAVDFGVIRIAPDGQVAVTNEAHGRLQQIVLPVEDAAGDVPAFRDDGRTALPREELPLERALRGEAFDGQIVWFGGEPGPRQALSITARRLTDSSGQDAGAVLVSRDVTAELNALRAREDLVASVSHELRTPLTSILGYLDLAIEDPELPDHVRSNLDIAERNAERLLRIIADILAASSTSTSVAASLSPVPTDARDIVRASAEALAPRAAGRSITIDTSGLEEAILWADPLRIRQVVDNLLSNAITYNREGGTVFLGTTGDGVSSWILVRDTGTGLTESERARLFQRFYKAGPSRRAGTGLGLAISRDIVRAHGGELGLHSAPGVGTTFIVKLPATAPEGTPA
ncbi:MULTISPECIES: PAS domain-containing sensor histidine kinase [unclassified Microbacterium]|uniref:sensor histidine kinase n=1 Tax=unclassified Microbacterium TaxID=2609290 RepID=UPI00214B4FE4|nr:MULTISPECIES: PAS domain-containing sensor histidine kinase [unclassified Microbacterium]MCR2809821.1 PAS domain-containing sensor histidine kinase [Microbacterium sp. zg.B185]WIM17869.1 ATP-binding protein [Microbacterium sp. zg-B185]